MDIDCQLLAWLAARAVDWPKTGVWRAEDTKLFEVIQRRVRLPCVQQTTLKLWITWQLWSCVVGCLVSP